MVITMSLELYIYRCFYLNIFKLFILYEKQGLIERKRSNKRQELIKNQKLIEKFEKSKLNER